MMFRKYTFLIIFLVLTASMAYGQQKSQYLPQTKYPLLDSLEQLINDENALKDSVTDEIQRQWSDFKEDKEDKYLKFRPTLEGIEKPAELSEFKQYFHFEPVPQHNSGMCWCFSATSMLESEVERLTGQKIKLSELHTVYYEYLRKIKGYIDSRGNTVLGEGSESNAALEIMDQHGAVPAEVFTGFKKYQSHNHAQMFDDIQLMLNHCKEDNYWDENVIMATAKAILDEYIGTPPSQFDWDGKTITPLEFYHNVLKINSDDYVEFMSTTAQPFYKKGTFDVPDNWWLDSSYYNIPLDEWYALLKHSLEKGYTVCIGGDVSEPGLWGEEDIAFIPEFDIPQDYINQDSREYRLVNGSTEDDHGIHIVGYTTKGRGKLKHDWFLIKDSGRGSRKGKHYGYYLFRDDFIKLKMMTFSVHKDAAREVLKKF